jgi:UDP-glucose-4-epimerase GalE
VRIFVTGGAGYIGSHVCKALARAGHIPIAFDNLSIGHRWAVKWGDLIEGDLSDGALVRRELERQRIDAVMHFAASAYVGVSYADPRSYYANNLVNGLNLFGAMVDAGVKTLVFSSTCATYGLQQTAILDETHPQNPVNPYGDTKLALERALHWYDRAYGLRSVSLRYFNAAGADPDGEIGEAHDFEPHLIPNVLQVAAGRKAEVEIFGDDYPTPDGTAVRDYVHVTDLAAAHLLALEHLARDGKSLQLNLGTGRGHSVREVVSAAEQATGVKIPVRFCPRRPGDPPTLLASGRAAQERLGWTPSFSSMDTILRTAWSWMRSPHGSGAT